MIISRKQYREQGICNKGMRLFCKRHGLDYGVLCDPGYPEAVIIATGDSRAIKAIEAIKNGR